MSAPTTFEALAAMRDAGGWYVRKRKHVLPALWRSTERGTFGPATWLDVVEFLWERYAPEFASYKRQELRRSAEAIIAEVRYHDHGMAVLDESTLALVS